MMKKAYLGIGLLLLVLVSGCAKAPVKEKPRVFWPPLPDQPRIEWIKNFYSEDDFPKTDAQKFAESMLGKAHLSFMQRPYGIASDSDRGLVYVADTLNKVVKVFDMNQRTLMTLGGDKPYVFAEPFGLQLDSRGRLYVADAGSGTVKVYNPDQTPVMALSGGGQFDMKRPVYLAVNERLGRIYVSDGRLSKVYVFDMESGQPLFSFGGEGTGKQQLYAPQGLAIDSEDRVYVAELLNTRIQVFDADGNYIDQFGKRGDQFFNFEGPKDLAFDSDGNLHIVDVRKAALMIYRPDGTQLLYTGGKPSKHPAAFAMPVAIHIDKNDRIYITDIMNRRFSIWRYFSEEYIAAHPEEFETKK